MSEHSRPAASSVSSTLSFFAVLAVGIVIVLLLTRSAGLRREPSGAAHPRVGEQLGKLELAPLVGEGNKISLADLQGHVTVLNLWATWCPPCRVEFPKLAAVVDRFDEHPDFQFLSVSSGVDPQNENLEELREETAAFARHYGADFTIYADPGMVTRSAVYFALLDAHGVFPTTLVIDRKGVIRGVWTGYAAGDEKLVEALVKELLAEGQV